MPSKALPSGWTEMTFGEMASQISERVDDPQKAGVDIYVGLEHLDPGDLRIRRRGTPGDVEATKLRVRPGQIIFGKRRAYQRKVAVADFDGIASAHAMILQEKPSLIPGFLPFFMQSDVFMDRAVTISEGGLSPTIKWKTLAVEKFLIPPPQQQRELVELMQGFEAAVESGQQALVGWRSLADTITETSFEAAPDRKKCGELCKEITVGVVVKPASYYVEEGVPALRSINVISNQIKLDNLVFFSEETNSLMHKSKLREDDVLIVRTGTPGSASGPGTTCVVPAFAVGYNCIDLVIVRPDSTLLDSTYLSYFLNSRLGRQQLFRHAVGLAQQHVNVGAVRQVEIPVMPLENQRNVVERVSKCLAQIDAVKRHLDSLVALRSSILNTVLTPSNPAEEPAPAEVLA